MAMEILVVAAAWTIQISAVLLAAVLIAGAVKTVEGALRKKSVKFLPRFLAAFLLLCAILIVLSMNPIVIGAGDLDHELTDDMRACVLGGAAGLYSRKIPLVPLCVEVTKIEKRFTDGIEAQRAEFTVFYFCLGKRRMEYDTCDGYNSYPMFALQ